MEAVLADNDIVLDDIVLDDIDLDLPGIDMDAGIAELDLWLEQNPFTFDEPS